MKKLFKLKDVLSNPYRDLQRFPVPQAKIEALMESIGTTGFWKNVGGREVDGKLQIASGHSRVEALRQRYKDEPSKEFEFNVEKLSDSDMLQMMARENKKIYAADLSAVIESVKAAVVALSEGKIERGDGKGQMPPVLDKTASGAIRYAPSFIAGSSVPKLGTHPYTLTSLAIYLGYTRSKGNGGIRADHDVEAALAYLENEELRIPGWDAKTLETFRTPDGIIPVDRVAKAAEKVKQNNSAVMARERLKAESERQRGESLQAQLNRAAAEKKRAQAEEDRLMKARLEATRKEDEEKAARLKQEVAEAKQKRIDAEKKRKQAEKEWEANQKAREASLEAQRKAEVDKEKRLEAQRRSFVKDECDQIARVLTNEHALFEELKVRGRDKRTTDEERKRFRLELEELSERALQARVFFYPELGKQIVKR